MLQHVYFSNENCRILGAYHEPEKPAEARPLGIVMLHGWAGYRIGAHQMFTKLARKAEAAGFYCLRFDFRGRGDSEGAAEDATLSTMIADTVAAVDWLKQEAGLSRIALVGDCSGAEVAIGAGVLRPAIRDLVLWSAPMVGADRSESDRARKWYVIKQYVLVRGGKGAGEEGAEEDERIDWVRRFVGFCGEVLFIYGGNDPTAGECIAYYRSLSRQAQREFNSHVVAGANHAFYSVKWEEEVMDVTLNWLTEQCQKLEARIGASSAR